MKRSFKLNNLDCANCAAKMETAINKIPEVTSASISFMGQRLVLEADDENFTGAVDGAQKAIKKVAPDCVIVR